MDFESNSFSGASSDYEAAKPAPVSEGLEAKSRAKSKDEFGADGADGTDGTDGTDRGEATKGAKGENKAKIKPKTFEEKLESWCKKINTHLDSTFEAYLQVGKALRMAAAAFEAEGKTMKDFDRWVTDCLPFNPTTASKYRRMSELCHVTCPEIRRVVNLSYLRQLDFTVMYVFFSAWVAMKKNPGVNNLGDLTWSAEGIFAKFVDSDQLFDVKEFTTRQAEKRLKLVGSDEGTGEVGKGADEGAAEGGEVEVERDSDSSSTSPEVHSVGDRLKKLKSKYTVVVTRLNRERKELRQKLNEALQRADELSSELAQLRSQASG